MKVYIGLYVIMSLSSSENPILFMNQQSAFVALYPLTVYCMLSCREGVCFCTTSVLGLNNYMNPVLQQI